MAIGVHLPILGRLLEWFDRRQIEGSFILSSQSRMVESIDLPSTPFLSLGAPIPESTAGSPQPY
jgi:hypothetical protein